MKSIKGWAYLIQEDAEYRLAPWGNGNQWQYPIFPSRKEAREWNREHEDIGCSKKLKKVNINIL